MCLLAGGLNCTINEKTTNIQKNTDGFSAKDLTYFNFNVSLMVLHPFEPE